MDQLSLKPRHDLEAAPKAQTSFLTPSRWNRQEFVPHHWAQYRWSHQSLASVIFNTTYKVFKAEIRNEALSALGKLKETLSKKDFMSLEGYSPWGNKELDSTEVT